MNNLRKTALILAILLLKSTLCVFAQTARSGFVDGFDKSKYKEMTLKEFRTACIKSDSDIFARIKCHLQRIRECESGVKEFHCYGDGISDPFASMFIPSDIPPFTAIELYIRHKSVNAGSWYSVDGWRVVDEARFVGQKYIATDALKIRESPSLSAKQIGRLVKAERATVIEVGEDVTIDGIESAWVKVRTKDGAEGWCFAGYLTDGTEYRVPMWKTLCAFDWTTGDDLSWVYRFYQKDGKLYMNIYSYAVHGEFSLKLEYRGAAVEIVERNHTVYCSCEEVNLFAFLGETRTLSDGKKRVTLYAGYDNPYLYAIERYKLGKGENE